MSNKEKYDEIFMDVLGVTKDVLQNLKYQDIKAWDSVGHMNLIAAIEDKFDIMMDTDDIIGFDSYEKGLQLLEGNYEIRFN